MENNKKILGALESYLDEETRQKIIQRLVQNVASNKDIMEKIEQESQPFRDLMAYYQCALMEIETKFRVLNEEFSLQHDRNPIESIKTRLKSMDSIVEKMGRKNIPFSTEAIEKNLFDIAGIRIICSFKEDIYMLAECLLEQDDVFLIERKDYIQNPKDNGYRSLHLIVETPIFLQHQKRMMKVEVQLRTIAMDFWASLEHKMKYKKNIIDDADEIEEELRICADESAALDEKMDMIRKKLKY